jgi:hypothetical protein
MVVSNLQDVIYDPNFSQGVPSRGAPLLAPPVVVPPIRISPLEGGALPVEVPNHDVFQDSILTVVSQTLYQSEYQPNSDPQLYLDFEINLKEFELILVKFALLVSDILKII